MIEEAQSMGVLPQDLQEITLDKLVCIDFQSAELTQVRVDIEKQQKKEVI